MLQLARLRRRMKCGLGFWDLGGEVWETTDLETWLGDALYVWEIEIDRTHVRVLYRTWYLT